MTSNVVNY